jgi:hypothetical protein
MLEEAEKHPIKYDEDSPKLTPEELAEFVIKRSAQMRPLILYSLIHLLFERGFCDPLPL